MKIYTSNVGGQDIGEQYYRLYTISRWDFSAKRLCYKTINDSVISFGIQKCKKVDESRTIAKSLDELTKEMEKELIRMGYWIPREKIK